MNNPQLSNNPFKINPPPLIKSPPLSNEVNNFNYPNNFNQPNNYLPQNYLQMNNNNSNIPQVVPGIVVGNGNYFQFAKDEKEPLTEE